MNAELKYLLDTDICIFIQRQEQPSVLARFEEKFQGEMAISVVTYGELYLGALKSQRPALMFKILDEFLSLVPVVPMPVECGELYGAIRCDLEKRGLVIGNNDMWIAAHALSLNVTLVTNNTREFERIPHLNVENWV